MEVRQTFYKEDIETILSLFLYKKKGGKSQMEVQKGNMRVFYFCTGLIGLISIFLSCLYFIFDYHAILTKISWVIALVFTLFSLFYFLSMRFLFNKLRKQFEQPFCVTFEAERLLYKQIPLAYCDIHAAVFYEVLLFVFGREKVWILKLNTEEKSAVLDLFQHFPNILCREETQGFDYQEYLQKRV